MAKAMIALVLALTALTAQSLSGCQQCGWCRQGFSCEIIVLTVHDGVTREQVEALNASIGATTEDSYGGLYTVRIPPSMSMCDAMDFYESHPEVFASALPNTDVFTQ